MATNHTTYCKSCGAMGFSGTRCEYCGNALPYPKGIYPPHSPTPQPISNPHPINRPMTASSVLPSQRQKSESCFSYIWNSEPSEEVAGFIWLLFIVIGIGFYFLSNMQYSSISSDDKLYIWIGIVAVTIVLQILNSFNLRILTTLFLIGTVAFAGYWAKDSYCIAINNEKVITDSIVKENARLDSLKNNTYMYNVDKHKRKHRHRRYR